MDVYAKLSTVLFFVAVIVALIFAPKIMNAPAADYVDAFDTLTQAMQDAFIYVAGDDRMVLTPNFVQDINTKVAAGDAEIIIKQLVGDSNLMTVEFDYVVPEKVKVQLASVDNPSFKFSDLELLQDNEPAIHGNGGCSNRMEYDNSTGVLNVVFTSYSNYSIRNLLDGKLQLNIGSLSMNNGETMLVEEAVTVDLPLQPHLKSDLKLGSTKNSGSEIILSPLFMYVKIYDESFADANALAGSIRFHFRDNTSLMLNECARVMSSGSGSLGMNQISVRFNGALNFNELSSVSINGTKVNFE